MRGALNDALRWLVGLGILGLGVWCELVQRARMRGYRLAQARLRRRYRIADATPILPYGAEQEESIARCAQEHRGPVIYALTSGSTGAPKRILYPTERIAAARWAFMDAFARAFLRTPLRRHSFYLFGSMKEDGSLTALMMAERRRPSYLVTLQAPYRIQGEPALRELAARYGDGALRLWVLALANPGVLYSTNPSTLAVFLDATRADWPKVSALVRDFALRPESFPAEVHALARNLTSRGARDRLRRIAASETPLPPSEIAPAVHTYVCWTGGYVQPFLHRLATHLPAPRYRLLPMYSMSTETPETTHCFRGDRIAFVPLAPGVLYEFLPEGEEDDPARLVPPHALEAGRRYTMVVSDAYGLRRYQTDDLFECVGQVGGLPDLRFLRRRSLSYSFTGEKLTGEQVSLALARLRAELPALGDESFLTCIPSIPDAGASLPHYRLVRVNTAHDDGAASMEGAAERCDAILAELNQEYRAKRESGRLGAMRGEMLGIEQFVAQFGGGAGWEGQFKFLPLSVQRSG